jgi:hypothetical protein
VHWESPDSSVNSRRVNSRNIDISTMKRLQQQTLLGIRDQLGGYAWDDAEISELVNPQLGIITGFQELLDQLELLRKVDLGSIPPAADISIK